MLADPWRASSSNKTSEKLLIWLQMASGRIMLKMSMPNSTSNLWKKRGVVGLYRYTTMGKKAKWT